MNSGVKYGSGRKKFVGSGLSTNKDALDPALYSGSVLYNADDVLLYYSNGDDWVQLQPPIIRIPVPIEAITATERRQLRITPFVAGPGYDGKIQWLSTKFYISKNRDMSAANTAEITSAISTDLQSILLIDRPPNTYRLELGETFYWQAEYYGLFSNTGALTGPSDRSKVQTQVFPDNLIETPSNVTLDGSETDRIVLSDYSSPFGLPYSAGSNTYFEIYNLDDYDPTSEPPGLPIYRGTSGNNSLSVVNVPGLNGDLSYFWRGKYSVPIIGNSFWSSASTFSPPYANLVLYIDTTKVPPFNAGKKTFYINFGNSSNTTISWGDGTSNTVTSNAATINDYKLVSHDYDEDGIYRVELGGSTTGTVTRLGDSDVGSLFTSEVLANSQSMIINCTAFGTSTGIQNLTNAFRNAKNLTAVTAYLPTTVTTLRRVFQDSASFNSPSVSQWDVSRVGDFAISFYGCKVFNQDLSKWNTRSGLYFDFMFQNCTNFNSNISYWDTTNLTSLSAMFSGATSFNQNLNRWNTSRITNMASVFQSASVFNGSIATWDTSSVTNMQLMFFGANSFNGNISYWNTSSVTNMFATFTNAKTFNQPLNNWNVSRVTNMQQIFNGASKFNQDLNLWNTSSCNNMYLAFASATAFNGNVSTWNTANVTIMQQMFNGATKFNQNLDSWNTSSCNNMSSMFSGATIFNGNVSTWNTSNVTTMASMFASAPAFNCSLNSWNVVNVANMSSMFSSATAFNQNLDSWNTSSCNNMSFMFISASVFNGNVSTWDTSKVTTMSSMFRNAFKFNQNLNGWNTSNVTTMSTMFTDAREFNQNLESWNTSNVTTMQSMFQSAWAFNGNVSTWNTSKVTNMLQMFYDAKVFNQSLNNWNTANVTTMTSMFYIALRFNQNLHSWDTSKISDMTSLFWGATAFNGNVSTWNTSNVVNMTNLFRSTAFNQNVSSWNTSKVTNMLTVFSGATAFNQNVATWNTGNVTNMSNMFNGATVFNQNIASWNTSKVINFDSMFLNARAFNQDLSAWRLNTSSELSFSKFANGTIISNTNFARLLISFANQTKLAGDNPKNVQFTNMSDRFYSTSVDTGTEFGAINTAAQAVTYLFDVGTPVGWIKNSTDARPGV